MGLGLLQGLLEGGSRLECEVPAAWKRRLLSLLHRECRADTWRLQCSHFSVMTCFLIRDLRTIIM